MALSKRKKTPLMWMLSTKPAGERVLEPSVLATVWSSTAKQIAPVSAALSASPPAELG